MVTLQLVTTTSLQMPFRKGVGANYARTALLLGAMTALVVVIAHALGGTSAAVGALVVMGVVNLISWYKSDRIVIAVHRARPLEYAEAPAVHDAVNRLARRASIPTPRIFYVPNPVPNAFATGRNPEHAVVAVTDGLLRILNEEEIEGVIAHELSHVLNRDMLISTVAATMAGAISLVARIAGWSMMFGGRRDQRDRGNPLASLLLILVAPLMAAIVQMAVSRSREYGADATGARLAGNARGLARALAKLEAVNDRAQAPADPAFAHLYIVEPRSILRLFSTHPPVEERIRRLEALT
jgi:heat shock protein HtpX